MTFVCLFLTFAVDAIIEMLESAEDIVDHANQTFMIGKGLTRKGLQQLGRQLANMTIIDLASLLELNNANPTTVHEIIENLISLTTALVSYNKKCKATISQLHRMEHT